jgi:hypothetical protein
MRIVIVLVITLGASLISSCKPRADSDLKELPETPIVDMFDEASHYQKNLQAKFGSSGLNFAVNKKRLILNSPIEGRINLLSRFGTPTIAKIRFSDDGDPVGIGYFHDALDIARKNPQTSNQVFAPVSGKAKLVFDQDPEQEKPVDIDSYSTSIVIHDEQSNALISLLHVKPLPKFYESDGFIDVTKGEVIGQISNLEGSVIQDSPEFRHVHLMVIDFEKRQFINPSLYLIDYKDTLAPHIGEIAFYDEQRKRHSKLISGRLDLVLSTFDKDNFSTFNQEIAQMSVVLSDQHGKELFRLPPCNFENFWFQTDLRSKTPLHAVNIQPIFDPLPVESANIVRENIIFEYASTNLKVVKDNCEIIEDEVGYFSVDDSVKHVTVNVTVTDHFGNQSNKKFEISR